MCGIVAVVGTDATRRAAAIRARLDHRGPDGHGAIAAADDRVALAHARLAIIDPEGGSQPFTNEDRTLHAVVNGQIYNEPMLRRDLIARGHRFQGGSDCEVVLHLYEELGEACVEHLDGMFAFVIFDERRRRLVAARDRLGIKPLAYVQSGDTFLVSSEVAPLLIDPAVAKRLDPQALACYLTWGFVPSPLAIIAGVRKLEPGHVLVHALDRPASTPTRYWTLPSSASDSDERTQPSESRLATLLESSVATHLRADVPVGIFLSGGIDSGLIASFAVARGARPPCFTLGFAPGLPGDSAWDERGLARQSARHLGLHLTEVEVDAARVDAGVADAIRLDEPFADSSALLMDALVRAARTEIKVALSGEGGDELFGGYARHQGARLAGAYAALPLAWREALARRAPTWWPASPGKRSRRAQLARFLSSGALEPTERYLAWLALRASDRSTELVPRLAPHLESARRLLEARFVHDAPGAMSLDPTEQALAFDLGCYLPDDLLVKADRVGLESGLELRVPFLDRTLVEEVSRWPARSRAWAFGTKPLLRRLAHGRLPAAVVRARKSGFSLPLAAWLSAGRLPTIDSLLSPERPMVRTLVDLGALARLRADHARRLIDGGPMAYALAVLVGWCETNDIGELPPELRLP